MSVKFPSPLVPPSMTTTQRDAIPAGRRPPGSLIFNTTNNRLEVNLGSDATPSWQPPGGSGMRLLATNTGSSFDSGALSQAFKHLLILAFVRSNSVAGGDALALRFNNDTSAVYLRQYLTDSGGSVVAGSNSGQTYIDIGNAAGTSNSFRAANLIIVPGYSQTSVYKSCVSITHEPAAIHTSVKGGGWYFSGGPAITSVQLQGVSAVLDSGSLYSVYGLE